MLQLALYPVFRGQSNNENKTQRYNFSCLVVRLFSTNQTLAQQLAILDTCDRLISKIGFLFCSIPDSGRIHNSTFSRKRQAAAGLGSL